MLPFLDALAACAFYEFKSFFCSRIFAFLLLLVYFQFLTNLQLRRVGNVVPFQNFIGGSPAGAFGYVVRIVT